MIVAERKPFTEIKDLLQKYPRILVVGCGTCTSVCMAGGEKEVGLLAAELRMSCQLDKATVKIGETTVQRQCDLEYVEPLVEMAKDYDAVISMACGAGVQLLAQTLDATPVFPSLNTRFIGVTESEGVWAEKCRACGDCMLGDFAGVCPVTICTKGLTNGPCGGTQLDKCEIGDDRDCAWVLIYNRLKKQGRLDNLRTFVNPKDRSKQGHPSKVTAAAYLKPAIEEPAKPAESKAPPSLKPPLKS